MDATGGDGRGRRLRWGVWIPVVFGALLFGAAGVLVWLIAWAGGDAALRMDAVRTGFTVTFGIGGLATLGLLARRQWHQELEQRHREKVAEETRLHNETVARDQREDARERRITELYVKAVEQLGSEKAAVRLGGLYALDRLGRQHEEYRQVVVDVWCAYLRMASTPGAAMRRVGAFGAEAETAEDDRTDTAGADDDREVRRTAQRLLQARLKDPRPKEDRDLATTPAATEEFWPGMRVDLTGADLLDAMFEGCQFGDATFSRARFTGGAWFGGSRFAGGADFWDVWFQGDCWFAGVRFDGPAQFGGSRFSGHTLGTSFSRARFAGPANFDTTRFEDSVYFDEACFLDHASFHQANFTGTVSFKDFEAGRIFFWRSEVIESDPHSVWPSGWHEKHHDDGSITLELDFGKAP